MNAPNPLSDKRSAERKAYEPSMDEILASIRRIIADDQAFSQKKPPAPPRPVAEPRARIEPSIRPVPRPAPQIRMPHADQRVAAPSLSPSYPVEAQFHTFKPSAVPQPLPLEDDDLGLPGDGDEDEVWADEAYAGEDEGGDPLVSPQTDAAVSSSFGELAAM
jgi:uncharacterized protein